MSQEIEKEFKNLLTEQEYQQLFDYWNLSTHEPIDQTNYYFDTEDFQLAKSGMGLRIRTYKNGAEQTLKSPLGENEKLESTDALTLEEANVLLQNEQLKRGGIVEEVLRKANIDLTEVHEIGNLRTIRYEIASENGIFFLDKSYYRDQIDYEVEYETNDAVAGKQFFQTFVFHWSIPVRPTPNKIQRAVQTH